MTSPFSSSELFWCLPVAGPSWKPEHKVVADADTALWSTEVSFPGPTEDREGQRVDLGAGGGRWGQIGLARRINSTDGDNYMPSRMRPKRCHIWFAFYLILTSSSK